MSFTHLDTVPIVSNDLARGKTPLLEILPYVGLNPTKLCHALGILIDPAVSVPTARGIRLA